MTHSLRLSDRNGFAVLLLRFRPLQGAILWLQANIASCEGGSESKWLGG